jgi:hypothetical protein
MLQHSRFGRHRGLDSLVAFHRRQPAWRLQNMQPRQQEAALVNGASDASQFLD